ncbi:MAG: class I SAM-dependent methyltransferase [Candidatus Binatia bacterium]
MSDDKVEPWNSSYMRKENYIFYPHEELVKFLNRYIRKRTGVDTFVDLIEGQHQPLTALDFGCGIGAGVRLLHEFGVDAYGVDISMVAIHQAQTYARRSGPRIADRFTVITPNQRLPFCDGEFDFFVSCGVLDSMPFVAAQYNLQELARVTRKYGYLSLIAGDYRDFYEEEEVTGIHEANTVQSYFNYAKCEQLVATTDFTIRSCELVSREQCDSSGKYNKKGRYHLVLERLFLTPAL